MRWQGDSRTGVGSNLHPFQTVLRTMSRVTSPGSFSPTTASATIAEYVLTFSQHKGKKVKEVDPGFMDWLITKTKRDGEDFYHKGVNWSEIFRQYRADPSSVYKKAQELPSIDLGIPGAENQPPVGETLFFLRDGGIDSASKVLLKAFVLRKDQFKGFATWLKDYLSEAVTYGSKAEVQEQNEHGVRLTYVDYRYDGCVFRTTSSGRIIALEKTWLEAQSPTPSGS